eukprot:m.336083 g.336083  ORF g.336083 m.336083 type:complete len:475 (-) comp17751_c0_seq1:335-1759(-)
MMSAMENKAPCVAVYQDPAPSQATKRYDLRQRTHVKDITNQAGGARGKKRSGDVEPCTEKPPDKKVRRRAPNPPKRAKRLPARRATQRQVRQERIRSTRRFSMESSEGSSSPVASSSNTPGRETLSRSPGAMNESVQKLLLELKRSRASVLGPDTVEKVVRSALGEAEIDENKANLSQFLQECGWNGQKFSTVVQALHLEDAALMRTKSAKLPSTPESELSWLYREREVAHRLPKTSVGDVTDKMWSILVDWMIEVQVTYSLSQETLYLAIHILNQFVRKVWVPRSNLQLIGAASMLVASKYEEIYPPEVEEFVYICAGTYSRAAILDAERNILTAIDYRLSVPLPIHFLSWAALSAKLSKKTTFLAEFFLESTLQERSFQVYTPSLVAAAALDLAAKVQGVPIEHIEHMRSLSKFETDMIIACAADLNDLILLRQNEKLQLNTTNVYGNCRSKYSHGTRCGVAILRLTRNLYE